MCQLITGHRGHGHHLLIAFPSSTAANNRKTAFVAGKTRHRWTFPVSRICRCVCYFEFLSSRFNTVIPFSFFLFFFLIILINPVFFFSSPLENGSRELLVPKRGKYFLRILKFLYFSRNLKQSSSKNLSEKLEILLRKEIYFVKR